MWFLNFSRLNNAATLRNLPEKKVVDQIVKSITNLPNLVLTKPVRTCPEAAQEDKPLLNESSFMLIPEIASVVCQNYFLFNLNA